MSDEDKFFPLVRGGKIPPGAFRFLAEVEQIFPGTTKDVIVVRTPTAPRREVKQEPHDKG